MDGHDAPRKKSLALAFRLALNARLFAPENPVRAILFF
jgi:hypothetical protein